MFPLAIDRWSFSPMTTTLKWNETGKVGNPVSSVYQVPNS